MAQLQGQVLHVDVEARPLVLLVVQHLALEAPRHEHAAEEECGHQPTERFFPVLILVHDVEEHAVDSRLLLHVHVEGHQLPQLLQVAKHHGEDDVLVLVVRHAAGLQLGCL